MSLLGIWERITQYDCSGGMMIIYIIVIGTLIEIAPIRINPWTWLGRAVAHVMGIKELKEEVSKMRMNIDELDTKIDNFKQEENERKDLGDALEARRRILSFNDELLQNIRHSQEMFTNVLDDITSYEHYCETHKNFVNQRAVMAEANIKKVYQKCMDDHDFL